MALTPDELRSRYLSFFESKKHRVVASSPVVPEGDPTLLFTNAGMNQFKDVLLGLEKRDYVRAASVQKCIRAGGKHNDLDEVGKDGRHLTFFEMLGNWSFGEYYKKEAIAWAWEFVTEHIELDAERLYVSVYNDDDASYDIWHNEVGLSPERIVRLGEKDNFWAMGPTGPCGPCTEIYYDNYADRDPEPWEPGFDEDRFVEIWNLVFMEFNRDDTGEFTPLPMQSVDTGMGLDRVAAVLAETDNVFKTELFSPILEKTFELLKGERVDAKELYEHKDFTALCVIADHVRTITFSISDGAKFSNAGRGYVLRRILRRAVRFGRELGFREPFLNDVASAVVESFHHVYPELRLKAFEVATIIRNEEASFFQTIDRGIELFEQVALETEAAGSKQIDGRSVFKLYDTFGFPPDLTAIMAEERELTIDEHGYQRAMQEQRERSQAADNRYEDVGEWHILQDGAADTFVGYDRMQHESDVLRFRRLDDERFEIVLRESPFYAESGGQVGDKGTIVSADGQLLLEVEDTIKTTAGITQVVRVTDGEMDSRHLRKPVTATVNQRSRFLTACNHTATHLLHAALHRFVSERAFQQGSLVAPDRLRFDFSHEKPLTDDELRKIEAWVNEQIRANDPVKIHLDMSMAEAEDMGAMMIFEEKYGDRVRVVEVPGISTELCGGTHVSETNDIAVFRIVSETGVAAGVRRIEGVTNQRAFEVAEEDRDQLNRIADKLKTKKDNLEVRVDKLLAEQKELENRIKQLSGNLAKYSADELAANASEIDGVRIVASVVAATSRDDLMQMADYLRDRLGDEGVALLAAEIDGKPALTVMSTQGAFKKRKLKAGDLVNDVAVHVGGRGGGKPILAQAGGKDASGIAKAVDAFTDAVRARLT